MVDPGQRPSEDSFAYFERAIGGHSRVRALRRDGDQVYIVERKSGPDVRVWLCDIYTLGVADYYEIREADPDIDAIVVVSLWNSYTEDAADQARDDGIGIFKPGEFMSALHRSGD